MGACTRFALLGVGVLLSAQATATEVAPQDSQPAAEYDVVETCRPELNGAFGRGLYDVRVYQTPKGPGIEVRGCGANAAFVRRIDIGGDVNVADFRAIPFYAPDGRDFLVYIGTEDGEYSEYLLYAESRDYALAFSFDSEWGYFLEEAVDRDWLPNGRWQIVVSQLIEFKCANGSESGRPEPGERVVINADALCRPMAQ